MTAPGAVRRPPGRPYIGPKVQVNVPQEEYDAVLQVMKERGWTMEDYPDMQREVYSLGVAALLARGEE